MKGAFFLGWENMPEKMPAENITVNARWHYMYHYEAREATCSERGMIDCYYADGNYYSENEDNGVYTYTVISGQTVETPETGHSYASPVWEWFIDGYSGEMAARLTLTCSKCNTEARFTTAYDEVTSEVTTEPTDTTTGVLTYTASITVDKDRFNTTETQTYTGTHDETIPTTAKIACIGDTWYSSLNAALNAARGGDTVTLSVDVYEPDTECGVGYHSVTLDLNGHEVTLKEIDTGGSLTVKNGTPICRINNGNTNNADMLTLDNAKLICEEKYSKNSPGEDVSYDGIDSLIGLRITWP